MTDESPFDQGAISEPLKHGSAGVGISLADPLIERYTLEDGQPVGSIVTYANDELRIKADLTVDTDEYSHVRLLWQRSANVLLFQIPTQVARALGLDILADRGTQAIICETGPSAFVFRFEPALMPWSSPVQEVSRDVAHLESEQRSVTPMKKADAPLGIGAYRFLIPGFWIWAYEIEAGDTVACRYIVSEETLGLTLDLDPEPDESTSYTRQVNQHRRNSGRSERHLYVHLPKQLLHSLELGFEQQGQPVTAVPGPRHLALLPQHDREEEDSST
jgi:hypothetical protein